MKSVRRNNYFYSEMEQLREIEGSSSCPSFNFYTSDSLESMAAAKFIHYEQETWFHEFGNSSANDVEFSLELSEEEVSAK